MTRTLEHKFTVNETTGNYKFTKVISEQEILDLAASIAAKSLVRFGTVGTPRELVNHMRALIGYSTYEQFFIVYLDNQNKIINHDVLFNGTIDSAAVYPRVVVHKVIEHKAARAILAHNHPSGVCEPSQSDKTLTNKLKQALALIDVEILDHIILTSDSYTSFREKGLLG